MVVESWMSMFELAFHFAASRSCALNTESWMPTSRTTAVPKSPMKRTSLEPLRDRVTAKAPPLEIVSTPSAGLAPVNPLPISWAVKFSASALALLPVAVRSVTLPLAFTSRTVQSPKTLSELRSRRAAPAWVRKPEPISTSSVGSASCVPPLVGTTSTPTASLSMTRTSCDFGRTWSRFAPAS
jgi:hypothetical protein